MSFCCELGMAVHATGVEASAGAVAARCNLSAVMSLPADPPNASEGEQAGL